MEKYVALLRAVNVAGKNKVNMKNLKAALQEEGLQNVTTYIQSGNLVLSSNLQTETEVAAKITEVIIASFNLSIDVFVFSEQNYKTIIKNNPFPPEIIGEEERWMIAFYNENIDIPKQKKYSSRSNCNRPSAIYPRFLEPNPSIKIACFPRRI